MSIKIIAEAGVNHNGIESLAFELVDAAASAGVDIVKFQTFKAKNLVTESALQADYQVKNTGKEESQLDMLQRLELSYEMHHKLIEYCDKKGVAFLSTAFDSQSLSFLVDDLKLKMLKLPSGELTNHPLVLAHAQTGLDIIVSTGMATLSEIESALGVIAFGYLNKLNNAPTNEDLTSAYFSEKGQAMLMEKVTLLHCTTEYPAPMEDINLNAMSTLKNAFKLNVGYSDHSEGLTIPIASAACGAVVIEKHFTLDNEMEGPDHKASLEPTQLAELVKQVRNVETAMGTGIKGPRPSEIKNKIAARKSLVANEAINVGEVFTSDNLVVKRPGNGISPAFYWNYIGRKALNAYQPGQLLDE